MSIHPQTRIQAYQLHKGGTPARMAILRMIATDSVRNANPSTRLQPGDWRGARCYTLGNYADAFGRIAQGMQGKTPVWYTHAGPEFRDERDACDVVRRLPQGWYTDEHCDDTAIGIVARLPHGRFLAGYRWTSNDERVYFPEVFDDEGDAARMSDEHARVFAEQQREWEVEENARLEAEEQECALSDDD